MKISPSVIPGFTRNPVSFVFTDEGKSKDSGFLIRNSLFLTLVIEDRE